jgi:NADH-quinone oxidoreductase subunit A
VSAPIRILAEGGVELLQGLGIFALAAFLYAFAVLILGKLLRPHNPNPDKDAAYECGESPVGSGWVQFNLRFYVVALVFLVFDVEIALFYPWAVVFGGGGAPDASWQTLWAIRSTALWDMLFFFGVIVVGFLYLWRFGYLDWVRSLAARTEEPAAAAPAAPDDAATARTSGELIAES